MPAANAVYGSREADKYESAHVDTARWNAEADAVREFLTDAKGTVLDVPVGTGRFHDLYLELGLRATGVDLSEAMLRYARKRGMRCEVGDIRKLRFADRSFDNAVVLRLLNHFTFAEASATLDEVFRVTRNNLVFSWDLSGASFPIGKNWVTHAWADFNAKLASIGTHEIRMREVARHGESHYCVGVINRRD